MRLCADYLRRARYVSACSRFPSQLGGSVRITVNCRRDVLQCAKRTRSGGCNFFRCTKFTNEADSTANEAGTGRKDTSDIQRDSSAPFRRGIVRKRQFVVHRFHGVLTALKRVIDQIEATALRG